MSPKPDFAAEAEALKDWMFGTALPFWADIGVDRAAGGFFERLSPDGVVMDDPRRARLVSRQIYVFATAARLGWDGPARELVRHGLAALERDHLKAEGLVIPSVAPGGAPVRRDFDLYDHAFVLFGLAAAAGIGEGGGRLAARAAALRDAMRAGYAHPEAGFEEGAPPTAPLKANPHMHLLEAFLAWEDLAPGQGWEERADKIAQLCLDRFIDPATGAVHEYYDRQWRRIPEGPEAIVEPGHQFEWAWLLLRWGARRGRPDAIAAALRLINLAEAQGVDAFLGLALNELDPALAVRDNRARLWPQTERVKAHALLRSEAASQAERIMADHCAAVAVAGLRRFLVHPVAGSWWEHIGPDGQPLREPARASSLYHIMGALEAVAD
ncbi:AGE family epimerase/isomerase [Aquabacter cavernae]|uniref:AGE family epimerase/isomerase n=1 Tax=Aquabacter cavernae TaxID=2496029 RepID=UPI000F8C8C1C|nr:AGE family epimerase/isomerase [Aquabacter cavernae]